MATLPTAGDEGRKLTGRAFYDSIGSPRVIIAPMVDQSEFVSFFVSRTCMALTHNPGVALAYTLVHVTRRIKEPPRIHSDVPLALVLGYT